MNNLAIADLLQPPDFPLDPFSDEVIADPREFQKALRDMAPVVYMEKYDLYGVGRYAEAKIVITDFERFTSTGGNGFADIRKPGALRAPSPIAEVDPPQHTQAKGALSKILSPLIIRQWRPRLEAEADRIADQVVAKGEVDAVSEIAEAFVVKVFPDLVGVDIPREYYVPLGEMNFNHIGPNNDRVKRTMERVAHMMDAYQKGVEREAVLPGGIAEKIYAAQDAGEFAPETAGPHVRSFLRGGVDTTIAGIGHTLTLLAQNPDQWEKVKQNPAKVKVAFEEAIRLHSPATVLFRTTTSEVDLSGYRLKAGTKVGFFLGAANRDPRQYENPDKFDVDRNVTGMHLAFGVGHHACIGQMIARLEAEIIVGAIVKRVKAIEIIGAPKYRLINALRSLEHLNLRIIPE